LHEVGLCLISLVFAWAPQKASQHQQYASHVHAFLVDAHRMVDELRALPTDGSSAETITERLPQLQQTLTSALELAPYGFIHLCTFSHSIFFLLLLNTICSRLLIFHWFGYCPIYLFSLFVCVSCFVSFVLIFLFFLCCCIPQGEFSAPRSPMEWHSSLEWQG
jgi:hypothetical protein